MSEKTQLTRDLATGLAVEVPATEDSSPADCSTFDTDDLLYALENAAEFLESEEWPEPETKEAQEAANREGAKRIRRMVKRLERKLNGKDERP